MKKRISTTMVGLALAISLCACGGKEPVSGESTLTESTGNTAQTGGASQNSEQMYQNFLAGTEKVYTTKKAFTKYDYESDKKVPYYDCPDGMTLTEMLGQVLKAEDDSDLYITDVSYTMLDCGLDNEPELGLRVTLDTAYEEQAIKDYVIKNIDGKLQLCHQMESYYRSNCELSTTTGMISSYGSYGAASYGYGSSFIDQNGDYQMIYEAEDSYWGAWALDERFSSYLEELGEDEEEFYIYYYDFVQYDEDNWDEILEKRMYCAETAEEDIYNEVDPTANKAFVQEIFDKANVKLYSKKEMDDALAAREKELGVTDAIKNGAEIEWISYSMDLEEANGLKQVTVNSVDALMNAINNNTAIILEPGEYNVTEWLTAQIRRGRLQPLYTYNEANDDLDSPEYYGEAQILYSCTEEEPEWVLRGLNKCVIRSADPENPARIVSTPRGANVLQLTDSKNVILQNIIMGHTDGNDECAGDVLFLKDCSQVDVTGCDIYGCGATGLDIVGCYTTDIRDCVIHDCSVGGVYCSDTYGVDFYNTTFEYINGYGIISASSGSMIFRNCTFRSKNSPILSNWFDGYLTFMDCKFDEHLEKELRNHELFEERITIY